MAPGSACPLGCGGVVELKSMVYVHPVTRVHGAWPVTIPTCSKCGEQLVGRVEAAAIDASIEATEHPRAPRPSWDAYFMELARVIATRGTCPRRQVGAVMVRDRRLIATGYNGSLPGEPHCTDVGCQLVPSGSVGGVSCTRTVHAEANAIMQCARYGIEVAGATLYTTASPCRPCFDWLTSVGIKRLVYADAYFSQTFAELAAPRGIELVHLP